MKKINKPVTRRRRVNQPRAFVTRSYSLPVALADALKRASAAEYGGNDSALVSDAVALKLGIVDGAAQK